MSSFNLLVGRLRRNRHRIYFYRGLIFNVSLSQWAKEHERKSCDEYSAWLELSDPNSTISQHLIENDGIVCPKCRSKYALAKGKFFTH
jgi:hypothetical protein